MRRLALCAVAFACGRLADLPSDVDGATAESSVADASTCATPLPSTTPHATCNLRWGGDASHESIDGIAADSHDRVVLVGSHDDGIVYASLVDASCATAWTRTFPLANNAEVATLPGDRFALLLEEHGADFLASRRELVVLDDSGSTLWNKVFTASLQFGGPSAIASDVDGNVVVSGDVEGSVDFGNGPFGDPNANPTQQYLVKFDASGNYLWGRSFGAAIPIAAAIDRTGQIWLEGDFALGSVDFGDGHVISSHHDAAYPVDDGYVVRLASDGSFLAGTGFDDGELYFAAADRCHNSVLAIGMVDWQRYAVQYDNAGNVTWKTNVAQPMSGVFDAEGNVWLSGGDTTVSLSSYDPLGTLRYVQSWGAPTDYNFGAALAITSSGAIVMAGLVFSPSIDFGLGPLVGAHDAAATAWFDGFIVRFQ